MRPIILLLTLLVLASCAAYTRYQLDQDYGVADPARFDHPLHAKSVSYQHDVKPITDNRCAVCHGCFDAPCQLQMGSYEGITRGANKKKIYGEARLTADDPTRLFIDRQNNADWRLQGFYPILNERSADPVTNKEASVMARMLQLKSEHSFPKAGLLPAEHFDFSLYRQQTCPALEEFDDFAKDHPDWGMPFGLPPLSNKEQQTITRWLEVGAPVEAPTPMAQAHLDEVARWETFLNGNNRKAQLMSRYIYEHWFLAHLYFDKLPEQLFFELVRSKTPPGQLLDLIASRRPFDDPQVAKVYYRLRPVRGTLLNKTHMPYPLNEQRMQRIKGWFIDEPYSVTQLPAYSEAVAANPFIAFQQIPIRSRYRLMLDEAQFTVMGFIKGPVCQGQTAVNVINDYFWISFVHPDHPLQESQAFLADTIKHVDLPIDEQSLSGLFKWRNYSKQENAYLRAKSTLMNKVMNGHNLPKLSMLWDGDGNNSNAALTVFRNFDNATVVQGLVGEQPQTAMIIGYPLLERIHYLLVAGFDVFGTLSHQLQARLYMDFLRMEGELNVLAFLPVTARQPLLDSWYKDAPEDVKAHLQDSQRLFSKNTGILYKTQQYWPEFAELWQQYLKPVLNNRYELDATRLSDELTPLKQLAKLKGKPISYLPELSVITVSDAAHQPHYFTLLRNSAHSNVSQLFKEEQRRLANDDTLTLVPGFMGAYPNAFYQLQAHQLPDFIRDVKHLNSVADYTELSARYAIRRTDPNFWVYTDRLHEAYRSSYPIEASLFDLNRLENR